MYIQENVPLGGNTSLGCGPLELEQFWCRRQQFPPAICSRDNAALLMQKQQFRCKMQHLGQGPVGPSSGYLKWSIWGGGGGGGMSLFTTPSM